MISTSRFGLLAALAATSLIAGCVADGPVETRSYNLSGFDSISASNGVNVVLKQGPFAISAEGAKGRLDHLIIETSGATLTIRYESGVSFSWFSAGSEIITVSAPVWAGITASGGVDIDGDNLQLGDLHVDISGGVDVNLTGACKTLTLEASGGADFGRNAFTCTNADVTASGGADVDLTVTGAAKGNASGGGDIRFHGTPATFEKETSGGGDVDVEK